MTNELNKIISKLVCFMKCRQCLHLELNIRGGAVIINNKYHGNKYIIILLPTGYRYHS